MKKAKVLLILTVVLASAMTVLLTACGPALESISATYNVIPYDGWEINTDNEYINVTGHYEDGTQKAIESGWTIENPGTLVAGETNVFTISYEGYTCELVIENPLAEHQDFSDLGTTGDDIEEDLNNIAN